MTETHETLMAMANRWGARSLDFRSRGLDREADAAWDRAEQWMRLVIELEQLTKLDSEDHPESALGNVELLAAHGAVHGNRTFGTRTSRSPRSSLGAP